MENLSDVIEAAKHLSQNQKSIIKSLSQFGVPVIISFFDSSEAVILDLQNRGLVTVENGYVSLTTLSVDILQHWENQISNLLKHSGISTKKEVTKQERLEKSNQFLELYKQGFSYQDIGDKYGLSRERVRQVLNPNVEFRVYLREQEEAKLFAEERKKEQAKQELYSRSLAALYPERVAELWDYEKNGNLRPEEILAGSAQHHIWFKCSEGHSWDKKPNQIASSWRRHGTSGCPMCAGKNKKAERQPLLTDVYSKLIGQYWDYGKNSKLSIDPENTTLSSNKKAWFKCPHDGNEWQSSIASIISQQWSKGNAGCRVCNGTDERKRGEWKHRDSIAIEFPDEVAKYWLYEANSELGLDPMKLTIGSGKEAFFKCPTDGHEWVASITSISKGSWGKGSSGCPACRGLIATKKTSLVALYPKYIDQYWDYDKNKGLDLNPSELTRGSNKEAWFKCPIDEHEWKTRIGSITKGYWAKGNSGCQACKGLVLTKGEYLISTYPDHVAQYWDYTKNNELGIFPDEVTNGSQKEAWFKCSIDGYEWKTRIGSITRSAWGRGNSGCTRCGSGWTMDVIRQFVASLEVHIPNLTQAELYKIFEQSGVLDTTNAEGLKIVKDVIKGKLTRTGMEK